MPIRDTVLRTGDMHPNRALKLYRQDDGDVLVVITQDGYAIGDADTGNVNDRSAQVEFCVSGGRSRRTHQALLELMEAMRQDNKERSIKK